MATLNLGNITGTGQYQQAPTPTMLETFISSMVGILTAVAGIAFLLYFMLGALSWITAGGDKGKTESAQKQMTNAAIGLIAIVVAYFIAAIIGGVLGIDILQPIKILGL